MLKKEKSFEKRSAVLIYTSRMVTTRALQTHKQVLHLEKPLYILTATTSDPLLYHIDMWLRTYVEFEIFAAFGEITQCFEVDLTFFFFCLIVLFFSSLYYWEPFSVPQLIPVVECELRDWRAVFVFLPDPCCIDLYNLYWNHVLCRLQLWKCV